MNFESWLSMATDQLLQSISPRRDAEILLGYVTRRTRACILAFGETVLTNRQIQKLNALLVRRKNGEPIAYLIGECEFWSLPLYVSAATLIPRADTECLVEHTIELLPSSPCRILDLGTGNGAIALALASERPDCQVVGVEIIPDAIQLATYNIRRLRIQNVQIMQSNWFSELAEQKFDFIVSNPPYIDKMDPHLLSGDVRFEPLTALVADEGGLAAIRHIVMLSRQHLYAGGWLLIEHGWMQGLAVQTLFTAAGFHNLKTCYDYCGNARLTLGRAI